MKILHATKKYPNAVGGDATVVFNIAQRQNSSGNTVFILTPNCINISDSVNIIKYGYNISSEELDQPSLKRIYSLISLLWNSFKILRNLEPDIVHSHSVDIGFTMSFACHWLKIPIIHNCHSIVMHDKNYSIFKRGLELALLKISGFSKILTVDIESVKILEKYFPRKIAFIPNGVNIEDKPDVKKTNNSSSVNLIFVGRLEKAKGLEYLIEALQRLNDKNIKLTIVGNGSEKDIISKRIHNYNLENQVVFISEVPHAQVIQYIKNSDILVLPSISEGFGIVLLEAWAVKIPVVTTNVGTVAKICTNKVEAYIVEPKNPSQLAEAIDTLAYDKEKRVAMGEAGFKLISTNFTWEVITRKLDMIYREIVNV